MILEINGWETNIKFAASHFIPFQGKCSRLHGHDYGIRLKVEGEMDEHNMLLDFIEIKKILREMCEKIDHHLILPKKSKFMDVQEIEARYIVHFEDKEYIIPSEDVVLLDIEVSTAEELSKYFLNELIKNYSFPKNIKSVTLCLDEGPGQGACSEEKL